MSKERFNRLKNTRDVIITLEQEKANLFLPLSKIEEKIMLLSDNETSSDIETELSRVKVELVNLRKQKFRGFSSTEDYAKRDKEFKQLEQTRWRMHLSMGVKYGFIAVAQFLILCLVVWGSGSVFGETVSQASLLLGIICMVVYYIVCVKGQKDETFIQQHRAEKDLEEYQKKFTQNVEREDKIISQIQHIEQQKKQLALSKQKIPQLEEKAIILKQQIQDCQPEINRNWDLIKDMIPYSDRLKSE
jgi:hypothetical protein